MNTFIRCKSDQKSSIRKCLFIRWYKFKTILKYENYYAIIAFRLVFIKKKNRGLEPFVETHLFFNKSLLTEAFLE